MLMTRETDYALRVLRALKDGTRKTVKEISETELIPRQFAYKIIKKLSQAGLVLIVRGAEGGCQLAGDLNRTTLYDLLIAIEGGSELSCCMAPNYSCGRRERYGECAIHDQLSLIQHRLDQELRAHSLSKILTGEGG